MGKKLQDMKELLEFVHLDVQQKSDFVMLKLFNSENPNLVNIELLNMTK